MPKEDKSELLPTGNFKLVSKSVTKVHRLPNISDWTDLNAIIRDFMKIYFTKRSSVLRLKEHLPARKRVIVLTSEDMLLVYETNCTGYSFNIREALRMKYSSYGYNANEKSCTITFKYEFGYVNLVLVNHQIIVWRPTVSAIFEQEPFNEHLIADLSIYTAKDDDIDETLLTNRSLCNYTDSVISLKSARGYTNLSPSHEDITVDVTQFDNYSLGTNSNRSSTCLPLTMRSSQSLLSVVSRRRNNTPVDNNSNNENIISVRRGSLAVSYLAKKFESKMKTGLKTAPKTIRPSSPLEVLFPDLPKNKSKEEERREENTEDTTELQEDITLTAIEN
ncbi:unnamed protein product [Caenorhabditis brenneri]